MGLDHHHERVSWWVLHCAEQTCTCVFAFSICCLFRLATVWKWNRPVLHSSKLDGFDGAVPMKMTVCGFCPPCVTRIQNVTISCDVVRRIINMFDCMVGADIGTWVACCQNWNELSTVWRVLEHQRMSPQCCKPSCWSRWLCLLFLTDGTWRPLPFQSPSDWIRVCDRLPAELFFAVMGGKSIMFIASDCMSVSTTRGTWPHTLMKFSAKYMGSTILYR